MQNFGGQTKSIMVFLKVAYGRRFLLEWILQNMVRHFVTHKQVLADKRHPI